MSDRRVQLGLNENILYERTTIEEMKQPEKEKQCIVYVDKTFYFVVLCCQIFIDIIVRVIVLPGNVKIILVGD